MTGFRLSKRSRNFLLWTARLALVAYLVQLIAIDHWHTHPGEIAGVEDSSAHAAHCHGAGDCSDGGGSTATIVSDAARLPVPPAPLRLSHETTAFMPGDIFIAMPYEPPRAA
jgi:hypothetical protein